MSSKKDLIIPVVILVLLGSISLYFTVLYVDDFVFYRNLKNEGIETGAVLLTKGVESNGELRRKVNTLPSDKHFFIVKFDLESGEYVECEFGVSKNTYDSISRRDHLRVVYLKNSPEECSIPNSVSSLYALSFSIILLGFIFFIIFLAFLIYVNRSFKKPENPLGLTTELMVPKDSINCPECGTAMVEGYMPTIGGVSWRDRGEPVGIPTLLSGLPGTTFWIKRPMLHAYHCKNCMIITFKYGSKKPESDHKKNN